jgi:TonB family protein
MSDTTIKTVKVGFCIEKDGSVSNINLIERQDSIFNQEALRIISIMPKWIPATEDGENISKMLTQNVSFGTLTAYHIYSVIEQLPTFMDGQASISQYISSHLEYPKEAIKNKIEGTVILRFIIDRDGNVTKPTVFKGIGGGCDEEAIRIISNMPKWKPGKQNGKTVSVWYTLPIYFKLQ